MSIVEGVRRGYGLSAAREKLFWTERRTIRVVESSEYTLATRFDNYVKEEFAHFAFCKVKRNPRVIADPGKLDEYIIQTLIGQILEQGPSV
ncbi:UNVERIFIED_CONTAM: hypothetical protein Sradi_7090800 [Sesamum radiatum]|uniref:Uncharacterized protein n=1 Tax=Sesamum radiatum TaxID=300843 RepID=A0AAW2J556_SESRA